MSERTLVGSFPMDMSSNGAYQQKEHVVFAYESQDQTKSWKIKEIQVWFNPIVTSGGDNRALLNYCLSTDFLTPPASTAGSAIQRYARQFNASDNRGIAWGMGDWLNRDASSADFRIPDGSRIPFGMIADGRRAINYLILNVVTASEGLAIDERENHINYRIMMEQIKVTPSESILHQVRGLAQDVS